MAARGGQEKILCVLADVLAEAGGVDGGFEADPTTATALLDTLLEGAAFVPRTDEVERNPEILQFIAYGVLVSNGRVFAYRRNRKGTERRLHRKASIGIGGHVNPYDVEPGTFEPCPAWIKNCLMREINEEATPRKAPSVRLAGLIHDTSNEVGRVHVGVVYVVDLADNEIDSAVEIDEIGWFDPDQLEMLGRLYDGAVPFWETWSEILISRRAEWLGSLATTASA